MARMFGTDGVRGIVGKTLNCGDAMAIGRATAAVLAGLDGPRPKVLVGKDTRVSGDMLESALAAGLCSVGADVLLAGVATTPAVAWLAREYGCDAGIVISASHNPMEFNGIKVFKGDGYKLPDAVEDDIEALVRAGEGALPLAAGSAVGRITRADTALDDYVAHLVSQAPGRLDGLRVGVDCANGAAALTAPRVFAALGAQCMFMGTETDGLGVNTGCGATHLEALSAFVVENGLDCGVAFDGDADRCLAVDETGATVDGDKLIALFALDLKEKGKLPRDTAVVTVMSNLGLVECMKQHGVQLVMTAVGDRYVMEEMRDKGYVLGGEQSGHIILLDRGTTGDGQATALLLLHILARCGGKMSTLNALYKRFPQVMRNVPVSEGGKAAFRDDELLQGYIELQQQQLIGLGRVLVRPSGTEPLLRVMVEGRDEADITACADRIAAKIKERLS